MRDLPLWTLQRDFLRTKWIQPGGKQNQEVWSLLSYSVYLRLAEWASMLSSRSAIRLSLSYKFTLFKEFVMQLEYPQITDRLSIGQRV